MTKKELYQSLHWQELRRQAMERSNTNAPKPNLHGTCEQCGYQPWKPCLQLHHKTYVRAGCETLQDVVLLCPKCHAAAHGRELPVKGREKTHERRTENL